MLLMKNTQKMVLGRWSVKNNNKLKEEITVFWANSDHCEKLLDNMKPLTKS